MRSSQTVVENIDITESYIRQSAKAGAMYVLTPENSNYLDIRGGETRSQLRCEAEDPFLSHMMTLAADLKIWLHLGSIAVRHDEDNRLSNRSFLISPEGHIKARYDKIHMFDVQVGDGQTYQESKGYKPGEELVVVQTPFAAIGMSICYDLRFPNEYRQMAKAGANVFTVPAAFTQKTGEAHWHSLLRARAIENGAYVLAAAQGGHHADGRSTFGHSMIISPWGEILAEAEQEPGFICADIDLEKVEEARCKLPALSHDRPSRLVYLKT